MSDRDPIDEMCELLNACTNAEVTRETAVDALKALVAFATRIEKQNAALWTIVLTMKGQ